MYQGDDQMPTDPFAGLPFTQSELDTIKDELPSLINNLDRLTEAEIRRAVCYIWILHDGIRCLLEDKRRLRSRRSVEEE